MAAVKWVKDRPSRAAKESPKPEAWYWGQYQAQVRKEARMALGAWMHPFRFFMQRCRVEVMANVGGKAGEESPQ